MSDPRGNPLEAGGIQGIIKDPATLASTGLLIAVLFAVVAGLVGFFTTANVLDTGFKARMLNLTDTVDVGDVALLGIAVALLLLTPDPPGGVRRDLLMQVDCVLSATMASQRPAPCRKGGTLRERVTVGEFHRDHVDELSLHRPDRRRGG